MSFIAREEELVILESQYKKTPQPLLLFMDGSANH